MIRGVGTDIVDLSRIEASLVRAGEAFAKRILTASEFIRFEALGERRRVAFLAKRFAAKEAAAKALGTGIGRGISFQHFCVSNTEQGAPELQLSAAAAARLAALGASCAHLSLSDERDYAVAFVVLE